MPRYALTVAYDGTDFHGWQKQDPPARASNPDAPEHAGKPPLQPSGALRTAQGELERAVRIAIREQVNVLGASRTDAGVHAIGQTAVFSSEPMPNKGVGWPAERGTDSLRKAINSKLPEDLVVTDARIVHDDFCPIGDCVSKGYVYRFHTGPNRPLFNRTTVHHVWKPLDLTAMQETVVPLIGEHDFAGFATAGHGRATTVRTILDASVERESDDVIALRVSGTGFLWNMVRIIAGTVLDAGLGKEGATRVERALASGIRQDAGPTAPACGLCLEWIKYPTESTQKTS